MTDKKDRTPGEVPGGEPKDRTEERFFYSNTTEQVNPVTPDAPRPPESGPGEPVSEEPRFPATSTGNVWTDTLALIGVFIVANFVGAAVKLLLEYVFGLNPQFTTFICYLVIFGGTIGFALWQRKNRGVGRPVFRFSVKAANPTLILWGLVLVFVTSFVLEPLLELFPDKYMELLKDSVGSGGWAVMTTVIAAPLLEEILFRGIIQDNFISRFGNMRGVLLAAAVFGIVHLIPQQAVNAFFIGIILGYIYVRSGSLVPVIIIHAVNNAIAYLTMVVFGDESLYTKELIGNDTLYWILYAVCVVILVAAALNVWSYFRKLEKSRALPTEE